MNIKNTLNKGDVMENLKILVAEDDLNINNMIKEALVKEDYDAIL
ncbi:hypothetical protein [Clostridium sp. MB40-C1]